MKHGMWLFSGSLAALLLLTPAAMAVTWNEVGNAGQLPGTAQEVIGTDPLTVINGTISTPNDVDLYKIFINGGGTFSAEIVSGTIDDPQMFLFDSTGRGVYADDDSGTTLFFPLLPSGVTYTPDEAGTYYLAVSAWSNYPLSADGRIFDLEMDYQQGASGPGAALPLIGWNDDGRSDGGTYSIELTGARGFAPPNGPVIPEPLTLSGAMLALVGISGYLRRRRQA